MFERKVIESFNSITNFGLLNLFSSVPTILLCLLTSWLLRWQLRNVIDKIHVTLKTLMSWNNYGWMKKIKYIYDALQSFSAYLIIFAGILIIHRVLYGLFIQPHVPNINRGEFGFPLFVFEDLLPGNNLLPGDRQNVHDSVVNQHIIESVKRLGVKPTRPFDEIYQEISQYLIMSSHKKAVDAIEVLEHIRNVNMHHMNTNLTETEILSLVWQRINHPNNAKNASDLKLELLLQLADCKDSFTIVCGVGRIARIIQTLESLDADHLVTVEPKWVINENIGNYCGKYVNKLLDRLPKNYRDAVDALERTPEQQRLAEQFYNCVKNNLHKKFKLSYLDTKLLTQEQFNEMFKDYLEQLQ